MNRQVRQFFALFLGMVAIFAALRLRREHAQGPGIFTHTASLAQGVEAGPQTAEEHFSPSENLEQIDVARIRQAEHTLDIAMYAFTDQYLAEAIIERARAGVQVRIYRDRDQFDQEEGHRNSKRESTTSMFQGVPNIHVKVKGIHELMHLKAYLVDGKLLRTGSANWSPSGLKRQDNNAHFCTDPAQVGNFRSDFEDMWNRGDNREVQ